MVRNLNLDEVLVSAMKDGVVRFSYRKKNGEIRSAIGTTNMEVLRDYDSVPKCGYVVDPVHMKNNPYFDIEKCMWRSFSNGTIVSIVNL